MERQLLFAVYQYLKQKGFYPKWQTMYDDQWWFELRWGCPRRNKCGYPAVASSGLYISIYSGGRGGSDVHITIPNLGTDSFSRHIKWPIVDLSDPQSFEKIEKIISQFETLINDNIVCDNRADHIAIISALAPRPKDVLLQNN